MKQLQELKRRYEREKLRFFVPNGVQERFIKTFATEDGFVYLLLGANGIGKDALLINLIGNLCWGPQNEFFDYDLFRKWPYPKRIRIGTESKNVEEGGSIDTEAKLWWPQGRYTAHKLGKVNIVQYTTDTGWLIDKMSFEQAVKEWESVTLGACFFSEPPSEDIYKATVGRFRKGGKIGFFMTPLTGSAWISDKLVDTHSENTKVVHADIEQNCKQHGVRGVLEHSAIQRMMDEWDEEELDARAGGKFIHLSNVILGRSFKRDVHIVPDDLAPPAGCQWMRIIDPAIGKPWAIGWAWVDHRGQIVFDREYPTEDFTKMRESKLSISDYAHIIRTVERENRYFPVEWEILDRHFGNARNYQGRTLKATLNDDYGFSFRDSYNCEEEIEQGIQKVKDYLKFDEKRPLDAINCPRVLVKQRCKNIIRSLERSSRNPKTYKQEDDHYKDHFDIVRYACMAEPQIYVSRPFEPRVPGYVLGR